MISHFEHFGSFLKDNNLSNTLDRWSRAGFKISSDTLKHSSGRENGFILFTGGYLELMTIFNEAKFAEAHSPIEKVLRCEPRPHMVVMSSVSPKNVYETLSEIFSEMKSDRSAYFIEVEQSGISYCSIPDRGTPGATIAAIKYRPSKKNQFLRELTVGENTIYGITGLVFCSNDYEAERKIWCSTVQNIFLGYATSTDGFGNNLQQVMWKSLSSFEREYGETWSTPSKEYCSLAKIEFGAENPTKAFDLLSANGFKCNWMSRESFFVNRDEKSGFSFIVKKGNADEFYKNLCGWQ